MRFIAALQGIAAPSIIASCLAAILHVTASAPLCARSSADTPAAEKAENQNQIAAEKIADMIRIQFPQADIFIRYFAGQVSLSGEVPSPEMRRQIADAVFGMQNVIGIESNNIQVALPPQPPSTAPPSATRRNPLPPSATAIAPVPIPPAPVSDPTRPILPRTPAREALDSLRPTNAATAIPSSIPTAPGIPPSALPPSAPGTMPLSPINAANPYAGRYMPPPAYNYNAPNAAMPAGSYMRQPTPTGTFAPRPAYVTATPPNNYYPNGALPGGVLPGQYNQPTLPEHAWPAYAAYPNYAQVSYPRVYSPKAWPYIGPFYPYPQVPMGWRKVTLENHDGWWWLDFDDGPNTGPFSPLFRQPLRYTY